MFRGTEEHPIPSATSCFPMGCASRREAKPKATSQCHRSTRDHPHLHPIPSVLPRQSQLVCQGSNSAQQSHMARLAVGMRTGSRERGWGQRWDGLCLSLAAGQLQPSQRLLVLFVLLDNFESRSWKGWWLNSLFFLVHARRCLQTATPEHRDAATTALRCEPGHGLCPPAIPTQSIPPVGDPPGCRHRMLGPLSWRMRSNQGWNNPMVGRVCRGDAGR